MKARTSRRSRRQPGRGDRHANSKGRPVAVGGLGTRAVVAPTPKPGQTSCPVCRQAVAVTPRENLRAHNDLFGNPCPNRSRLVSTQIEAPAVVLPLQNRPPRSKSEKRPAGEPSRLDVGSECRECGKWLPGERSLCGRCYARSGR